MRGRRTRRAVSPIIAALILIMVAIAGGLIVWSWVSGMSKPKTVISVDIPSISVEMPPNGVEATLSFYIKSDSNVKLTVPYVNVTYNGTSHVYEVNWDIPGGSQITETLTIKARDFGVTRFKDGSTVRLEFVFLDEQGNKHLKVKYATLRIS